MSQQFRYVKVNELEEGMILADAIFDQTGKMLLSEGIVLRHIYIQKILDLGLENVRIADEDCGIITRVNDFESTVLKDMIMNSTRQDAKSAVKRCMDNVVSRTQVDMDKLYLVVNQIIDEILSSDIVAFNLSQLREVDQYIFDHSVNVSILSIITGIYMGFNKVRLIELGIGALLHDIGKILVPQDVLNKPDRLEDDEFGILKLHTIRGYEALKQIKQFSDASLEAVLSHHERCDGRGYPQGRHKDEIHVYAKIVAVADVFDAVTADKVYREKEDPYRAMYYVIDELDSKFDREIVKKFLKVVGYYPLGLYVTLNNGEYGIITKVNKDRPTVRILMDVAGNVVKDFLIVDMQKNPSISIVDIDPVRTKYDQIQDQQLG